jgi:hypothetical protein
MNGNPAVARLPSLTWPETDVLAGDVKPSLTGLSVEPGWGERANPQ